MALALALPAGDAAPAPREPPPGEGVVCLWAMVSLSAEVGRRCFPGENPGFQTALAQSENRIDDYVRANQKDITPEQIAQFKATQGHVGRPTEQVCIPDAIALYRAFEANGPELRTTVDRAVAAGPAELGRLCLRPTRRSLPAGRLP
jgi:hypothetical protein